MDALAWLRVLHIIFGTYLVGSYLFIVPILEPKLKRLGPAIQNPVMKAVLPIMAPINGGSLIILIGTGVAMTLTIRGGSLAGLLTTGWGWAIAIGFAASLAVGVIGFGIITPLGMRADKLGRAIEGRAPTPEESRQLEHLAAKVNTLSRITFALILVAFAAMLIARYV